MSDFGTELLLFDAFSPRFGTASGEVLVLASLYRRWTTDPASPPGRNIYKGRCQDLRLLLGSRQDPARLVSLARTYAACAREDPRVNEAVCVFEFRPQPENPLNGRRLVFKATVALKTGANLTMLIPFDNLTPEVLRGAA